MASVKVAVRVRPFNQREKDMSAKLIVQMEGKKTRLLTVKNSKEQNDGNREKYKDFTFDHSYWSFDHADAHYASQEQVFSDLGLDVIDSAFEGYNACVFAYGQTGSGKTFTMMGSPEYQGLIPRICRQLFSRVAAGKESGASYRTEVSYLEIYNERVKDLLSTDAGHSLRVREHPKLGPYVQDLSKHLVSDYDDIQECMHRGNLHRTTASTQMNDVSSRSHAIFTITFVQASYLRHNNMPSETVSKVHLVDLAGSERADATGATGQRLVEGAHINKSLVTLGSVISALAESSQQPVENRNQKGAKKVFIPYRDSVLTWLLKDSLGGNSKTIMIAAISPADCNYGETLSTLRYANRAKNIINKPTINEDPNVKLIRELREEIEKLRAQISHDTDPIEAEPAVLATLQRKEAQEKVLTEKWTEKWRETQQILQEQKALGLRKSGLGVVLDSDMPHLVGIDDNLLSTGVTLYHLKEGETVIGTEECSPTPDIVLSGAGVLPLHCRITLHEGVATLHPAPSAHCWLNTVLLDKAAKLSQGCILLLGRTNMFRYNDPAEAAKLRQEGNASVMNLSRLSLLSWSTTDLAASTENLNTTLSDLEGEIRCERIEAQRAELERERQQFILQQEERQRRWHREREELLQAQKKLDEEREAMEREYALACRRLSGDWRALERGWTHRRRALRTRRRELTARAERLRALADTHTQAADKEDAHVAALRARVEAKRAELARALREGVDQLAARGLLDESQTPSPTSPLTPDSETSAESLMHLLQQCEPAAAATIRDTVDRHKKELVELEGELQSRVASVASHRVKIERLQAELALLGTQDLGLRHALASDLSPADRRGETQHELQSRVASHRVKIERLQAELALLGTQDLGLRHALASDLSPADRRGETQHELQSRVASHRVKIERLQAELVLLGTQDLGLRHALASDLSPADRRGETQHELQSRVASHRVKIERLQAELVLLGTQDLGLRHALASDLSPADRRGETQHELQSRVASHRVKIERLQAELALLGTQDLGLRHALASDLSPADRRGETQHELQSRVASHRVKIERLQAELALLGTQDLGLRHALASDLSPADRREGDSELSPGEGVKRSKSELVLRHTPREEALEPLSADEREVFRNKRLSLSLSLDPLASANSLPTCDDTFHTATSSPPAPPSSTTPTEGEVSALLTEPTPNFRLGPVPDDSDDMSSTEDYTRPRIVEGQSSSSVERSPEERHQRAKFRRKIADGKSGRRQVTEAEALRAMQRLCSRIASQKMLVISSLENDCSKEELNRQIAVLQELQKKYVRLEMALQYSFFDNGERNGRTSTVTPIQEMPSLTLSESDAVDREPADDRLKEPEIEASDNVSTSNDETAEWDGVDDPLRRAARLHHHHNGQLDDDQPVELPDPTVMVGLMHPIDFNEVVSIPGWVTRGAGASTHHEYEVRIRLGNTRWALLRRYRRFRDLYLAMRRTYGPKVASIPFPPRQLWQSEAVARSRRGALESFLRRLLSVCAADRRCPLHCAPLTPHALVAFSPFFRRGVFESGKCGTG